MSGSSGRRAAKTAVRLARACALASALCLLTLLPGIGSAQAAEPTSPGLAVLYTYGDFRDLDPVVERTERGNPDPGEPILVLDQSGNLGQKVLGSNFDKFVGARLSGYLKFPQAGTYRIAMSTNDGTRVVLDGVTILEDAEPHPDRDAGPVSVDIAEPGWHPLTIYFYQRKGSWLLRLSWSGPGLGEMAPIGEAHLAH